MLRSLSVEDLKEAVERLLLQDLLEKAMHIKIIWQASIFDRPRRDSCLLSQKSSSDARNTGSGSRKVGVQLHS